MPPRLIDDVVRQAALGLLETGRDLDEWDQTPLLVLIGAGPDKPICIPVPIPDGVWLGAPPAAILQGLTYGVSRGQMALMLEPPMTPGDVRGVVLLTEGHDVAFDDLTPAEQATFDDFRKRHRLEEHPKSRELRMAQMIDRALTPALARHIRGEPVNDKIVYGFTGGIPQALERFVTVLMASWMDAHKTN